MENRTSISPEQGQAAISAVRRLNELNNQKIVSTNSEAEKAGLINFLRTFCFDHSDELLACWSAVRFEYEPLVGSLSLLFDRVSSIRRSRILANQVPAAPPENDTAPSTPSDIVPIDPNAAAPAK